METSTQLVPAKRVWKWNHAALDLLKKNPVKFFVLDSVRPIALFVVEGEDTTIPNSQRTLDDMDQMWRLIAIEWHIVPFEKNDETSSF